MVIPTLGGLNMSSYKKIEEKFSLGDRILPTDIPDIDLYMDQVIQLFDSKYQPSLRNEEDKVLTKTMINNYAKGKLLFPIKNKKYSKEHIMLISLIYQLKGSLSINDIKSVLEPLKEENIRLRDHSPEELSHYSNATTDIEFAFPFGWGELWGIADRTDYDLSRHIEHSKQDLMYQDPITNEKFIPYVIEPSLGCDRVTLAFLCNSYEEQDLGEGDSRVVLHLHPALAPYKVAVLPLSKKLSEKAEEVYVNLSKKFMCEYDESGSIGKRYRRQDEIGTPFCVTIDFDTLEDNTVTIRDRDTMEQVRVKIDELEKWIQDKVEF